MAFAGVEVSQDRWFLVVTSPLNSGKAAELRHQSLIKFSIPGWTLTHKGEQLWGPMQTYGDPRYVWRTRVENTTKRGGN